MGDRNYDDANRQTNVFDSNGNRTTVLYDANGNATVSIDVLGNRTTFLFDALNRQTVTVDALNGRTTKLYDVVGNLTGLKDASNNLTTFGYDEANRKIRETDPLGKMATFLYDAGGRLTRTIDRLGRRRDFGYTARNELSTEIWYDSGGAIVEGMFFGYDPNSNVNNFGSNGAGAYAMYYDALDRVTGVNEFGKLLTFSYDNVGNRTVTLTELGRATSTYDANNNLTRQEFTGSGLPTMVADFAYNETNQLSSLTRYSDTARTVTVAYSTYLYDNLNRITSQYDRKGSDNSVLASYAYLYDAASRITSQTINGATNTFAYDTTNQLTGDGTTNVTYDATGNRNNGSYTTGTGNRTTNDGTWTYTYDDEGNLKTKSDSGANAVTWTYEYDNRNQLILVERRKASDNTLQMQATYTYDVFGNRIKKEVDSNGDGAVDTTERYWYDGWKTGSPKPYKGNENYDIWGDSGADGVINVGYLRGDKFDQLVGRFGSGASNVFWTLQDRQMSVRNVLDSNGVNKSTLAWDGYGKLVTETDANFSGRYGYTGRERDVETQLQYNRRRYYDPNTGRWISQDPLGFDAGDSNLYRYVHNRHPMATDPSGLTGLFSGVMDDLTGAMQRKMDRDREKWFGIRPSSSPEESRPAPLPMVTPGLDDPNRTYTTPEKALMRGYDPAMNPSGGDIIKEVEQRLKSGGPISAFGSLRLYGMDGNQTASGAMVEAGELTQEMCAEAALSIVAGGPYHNIERSVASGPVARSQARSGAGQIVGFKGPGSFQRHVTDPLAGGPRGNALPRFSVPALSSPGAIHILPPTTPSGIFSRTRIRWTATRPKGTGQTYQIYRRLDIDWNRVRTNPNGDDRAIGLTNAEAARRWGLAPELSDGSFATLHHVGQDGRGPLAEASTRYHGVGRPGQDILHSQFGRSRPHPTHQPNRSRFKVDDREYWRWREQNR